MKVSFSAGPNWSVAFDPKDEEVVRESLTKAGHDGGWYVGEVAAAQNGMALVGLGFLELDLRRCSTWTGRTPT